MSRSPKPKPLTDQESKFVAAYLGDARGNGKQAAILAGWKPSSAKVIASKLLKKPAIRAALVNQKDQMVNQAETAVNLVRAKVMDGDEAMERLTLYARGDLTDFLDESDPLRKLPLEQRLCLKAITPNRYGRRLELHDAMHATELIAKSTGKLKEHIVFESLEDLIAASRQPAGATA